VRCGNAISGVVRGRAASRRPCELPQALLSFYAATVRETLGITGGKLLFGIAFGYADPAAAVNSVAVGREPLEKTTRFHR
jgi:hypothetical protein